MDNRPLAIVVNYDLASHIERLLAGGALADWDVLLVDNGSQPDLMVDVAHRFGARVLLLKQNRGFAGAVNAAVATSEPHPVVLLLNPDVDPSAEALAQLRTALAERQCTAVSPLLFGTDGRVQVGTAGGPATLGGFARYFLFLSHLRPSSQGVFHTRRQLRAGLKPRWLCMACLLLDGAAFDHFGPVPEHELVYAEDVAWGVAASEQGARFAVLTDVSAVHQQGASGAGIRWSAALGRLAVREGGPVRGRLAVACMRTGLALRRLVPQPR